MSNDNDNSIDWGTVSPQRTLIPVTNDTDIDAEVTAVVYPVDVKPPTRTEALRQAQQMRRDSTTRVDSTDGSLYAQLRRGRTDMWNLYRVVDPLSPTDRPRRFSELQTRNKQAVTAVLDALAPFHGNDTL